MNFSVVIPLYNKELHIERAIKSIMGQTCQDFEIIVVNDGSTDRSREVVESISDSRIRIINQSNRGVSAARNCGVEAARYEFIAFLDADDEWLLDFLDNIKLLINNFPDCGAYATAVQTIRPNGVKYYPNLKSMPPEPWIGVLPNFFEAFQDGLSVFLPSSIVIPKNILLESGGFPVGVCLYEDISCWINIAIRYPIAFNPKRLVVYHQEATNRSNIHKDLTEAPFIKIIQDSIRDGRIPDGLYIDALEFVAQRQILTAATNVIEGNPVYARQLLSTCRQTKKYKSLWRKWWILTHLPKGWPAILLNIKQSLGGN